MTIYSRDLWLRAKKYLPLKQKLRSICMHKLLSFVVILYRVDEKFHVPKRIIDHDHLQDLLKEVYNSHRNWLYQDYVFVDKPSYLHFSHVYKSDMYLPVEKHRLFSFHLKNKRKIHYDVKALWGKETGDPFSE